ncbi:MAG TPA: bifunctional biotin--[acetyl-CoA-carboxylase] ligase/biotin operon repressor BirA [Cycloclasticus sp.]|jgi:BirA family biotin operon repressor/biotin-[acetyl-CoA-carboxylase] ligase|nr:bifunctional biotin--[acetyl-CoA-carboxylase] ligase/biotin operon repressor BirA [Cycloclasticus sp.]HIL92345.1 bifunctional biotin--[acetyl-CoA-carboxylase] ligase/biotin operon repressor BirA [Cycloclasticus sp.]
MELTATHKLLIEQLADGSFISGQQLAAELGVSRTSIWNYLKTLEAAGFELHAVKGKGTRLKVPIELLDKEKITPIVYANKQSPLKQLTILDVCPSTNALLAQQHALRALKNGSVCMAEMQTSGRGRLGKTWVSPYGQNIYLSFLWNFKSGIAALSGLSLACGVAVCNALEGLGMSGHGLKWPNDILWQGKKLGGILVEIQGESQGGYTAIIGIGINYHMNSQASNEIDQPWTDVNQAYGRAMGRNTLAARLIEQVLNVLDSYEDNGLSPYIEQWNRLDSYRGKSVQIISGQSRQQGIASGISDVGELLLTIPGGETQRIMSGEVSLRLEGN